MPLGNIPSATPVFSPGESQGRGSLVGCRLWGCTGSDITEVTEVAAAEKEKTSNFTEKTPLSWTLKGRQDLNV